MPILMGSDEIGLGVGERTGGDKTARGAEHKIKIRSEVLSPNNIIYIFNTFLMFDIERRS